MKSKILAILLLVAATVIVSCSPANQISTEERSKATTNAIDSNKWTFTVNQVRPLVGRTRQANGTYTVIFNENKLVVYLPYFGTATGGADVLSGKGPLDFTSNDFMVNKQQTQPGEWKMHIEPKDYNEVRTMDFTLYANGSSSLDIVLTNRSGISYSGVADVIRR